MKHIDKASPQEFDAFWELYRRAHKQVEGS